MTVTAWGPGQAGGVPLARRLVGQYMDLPDSSQSSTTNLTANMVAAQVANTDMIGVRPAFVGFRTAVTAEAALDNDVTYRAQIRVGSTYYDCGSVTVTAGATLVESPGSVPFIARGTAYTVLIYVSVGAGGRLYLTNRYRNDALGIYAEWGPSLPDKTNGTAFTPGNVFVPGGFIGCMATIPASQRTVVRVGDSIMGASYDAGAGYLAARGVDFFTVARSGTNSYLMVSNFARRQALVQAAFATDAMTNAAINDYVSGNRTASQLIGNKGTEVSLLKAAGVRDVWVCTTMPSVTTSANPVTDTSQTTSANLVDGRRQVGNDSIRAGIPGASGFIDWARAVENPANDFWWASGLSGDGLHQNAAGNAAINAAMNAANPMRL